MPYTQTAMAAEGELAYHEYEGIATDLDERKRLVADLGAHGSMLLRNHGTLTVGETIGTAFLRMYLLERACEAQVHMLAAGREHLREPTDDARRKVRNQAQPAGLAMLAERLAWPALLRKAERLFPDFRS